MKKNYIASVKNKYTGRYENITGTDYNTKKEFIEDLKGNGYAIRYIWNADATEDEIEEIVAKYADRLDREASRQRAKRKSERYVAERMGMTVKQYKEWAKS